MIIQSLVDYYNCLVENDEEQKIPKPGWSVAKISGILSIDQNGILKQLLDLRDEKTTKLVPEQVTRSSGVKANFLCDSGAYFFNLGPKGKEKRTQQCFEASKELHETILGNAKGDIAKAILLYYQNFEKEKYGEIFSEKEDLLNAGGNFVFMVDGEFAHTDEETKQCWEQYHNQASDEVIMQCAITGKQEPIARLHTVIKGVRGAQSSGAALVSYNAKAFESYGKEQSFNASIGKNTMFAYTTALNYLLADSTRTKIFGDTTVVGWADNGMDAYADCFWQMFSDDKTVNDEEIKDMLDQLSHGKIYDFNGVKIDPSINFYLLGLSPNAARLSVRFFEKNTFGKLADHIRAHQERLDIVKPGWVENSTISLGAILYETVNKKSKEKKAEPILVGGLMKAILNDTRYPEMLRSAIKMRIRAEHSISWRQVAILKAIMMKNNSNNRYTKEVCQVALNEKSTYEPYVLGRLFAVYEEIQEGSVDGEVNATIKDKFFTSAAATPALIFPRIAQLSQAHMKKIRGKGQKGYAINLEKKLNEIYALLPEHIAKHLTLIEQESFFIGYYHQKQKRYEKKKENEVTEDHKEI